MKFWIFLVRLAPRLQTLFAPWAFHNYGNKAK